MESRRRAVAVGAPSGVVTFLFTDVERSTRLWEEHPVEMSEALRRHDEILRDTIESQRGYVFSTAGDAFCAAFGNPSSALSVAESIQRRLRGATWPAHLPIRVRVGVHTGVAEERDGNYYGLVLNRAARLMSAGHGGQVLVSDVTRASVETAALVSLGEHRLKDLGTPEHVWQLGHDEFPPLRTPEIAPSIPAIAMPASRFFGRQNDLLELGELVRRTRLVTVVGAGGIGKTRLAVQVAADAGVVFSDGVCLVELASITDGKRVVDSVSSTLGVVPQPHATAVESLVAALAPRSLLLLLDNCEHVLDGVAELVESVLRATTGVHVLATSREPLEVDGERRWPVEPLTANAEELFRDRAAAVAPHVDVAARGDLVSDICRRLDGLPLAIELAAARLSTLSLDEIASGIDDPVAMLTAGRRSAARRHGSLRNVVDWSFRDLDPSSQTAFVSLAVFAGRFEAAAAAVVTGIDTIGDEINGLVERSLLERRDDPEGTRYEFLQTIRSYARELQQRGGTERAVHDRHAHWAVEAAEDEAERLLGPDEREAHRNLEAMLPELRAAHEHLLGLSEPSGAYRLTRALHLWALTRAQAEVFTWADRAVARFGGSGHPSESYVIGSAATGAWQRGDLAEASALLARAERCPSDGTSPWPATLEAGADVALLEVRLDDALELSLQAAELASGVGDLGRAALYRANAALACAYAGRTIEAIDHAAAARVIADDLGAPTVSAWVDYCTGESYISLDPDRAITHLERARDEATDVGARFVAGVASLTWVSNRARIGEPMTALPELAALLAYWRRTGTWLQLWTTVRALVEALAGVGDLEGAATLLGGLETSKSAAPLFGSDADRLASIRDRIGTDPSGRTSAALDHGRAMSDDAVIEWALGRVEEQARTAR